MNTITSKKLRQSMDEVFDKVNNGQTVKITHRFKKPIIMIPLDKKTNNKKMFGLEAFDIAKKSKSLYDTKKTIKQLYAESLLKKYDKK